MKVRHRERQSGTAEGRLSTDPWLCAPQGEVQEQGYIGQSLGVADIVVVAHGDQLTSRRRDAALLTAASTSELQPCPETPVNYPET
jgi:hypothetical protein